MAKLRLGIILAIVGAILVIVGAVWMTVIFPSMEKIPADYERTTMFEGNYTRLGNPTPVIMTRVHTANRTVGDILIFDENITVVDSSKTPPQLLPEYARQEQLAVDRKTRKMNPDYGDIPREGQWSPPPHLKEGEDFLLWNPAANKALNTTYVGKEKFRGMKVLHYTVNETHLEVPHRPEVDLVDVLINLWVEPESGTTVGQNSLVTYSIGEMPVFISEIAFTDETVDELVDIAKDARTKLRWFGSYIPWIVIALGIVLVIVSIAVMLRKGLQKV